MNKHELIKNLQYQAKHHLEAAAREISAENMNASSARWCIAASEKEIHRAQGLMCAIEWTTRLEDDEK